MTEQNNVPTRVRATRHVLKTNSALTDMMELSARILREGVTVDLQAPAELWPIEVDPSGLESAIINAVVNARDAMPAGGVITILAENLQSSEAQPQDLVQFSVTDTGVGLDPHLIEHVFEPFFTTKPAGEATGLGLSQVYGFARRHGGDADFQSELGKGSTLSIRIPRSLKDPPAVPEPRLSWGHPHVPPCNQQLT